MLLNQISAMEGKGVRQSSTSSLADQINMPTNHAAAPAPNHHHAALRCAAVTTRALEKHAPAATPLTPVHHASAQRCRHQPSPPTTMAPATYTPTTPATHVALLIRRRRAGSMSEMISQRRGSCPDGLQ